MAHLLKMFLRKPSGAVMACAVLMSAAALWPSAQRGAMGEDSVQPDRQVTVSADRLVSDRATRTATFTGRVKVIRGSSTIEADRLRVVYGENASRGSAKMPGRSAIERIVAEGNVRIRTNELSAKTPKAIYSRPAQTIELLGAGTQVISGNNSITGMQIVLYMEGERLTVSSGGDNRVKAVFEPSTQK